MPTPQGDTVMNILNYDLARALMDERLAEAERVHQRRRARLTQSAEKHPQPAAPVRLGWLARLVPSSGARVRLA
jgi:hypothetical protein